MNKYSDKIFIDKIKILIIEDDPEICKNFIKCADELNDVLIIGITNNADKALTYIQTGNCDAIILDLDLHFGSESALDILKQLSAIQSELKPYILITTDTSDNTAFEYVRQLGVDFSMSKHQENYSEKNVLDLIRMMKSVIKCNTKNHNFYSSVKKIPESDQKQIADKIMQELNFVGISSKSIGYKYLIEAIYIAINNPKPKLCTTISQKYGKTESSVERAMQNAINRAWKRTDMAELLNHYTARINPDKGMPTLNEFIYYYANRIKIDC